MVQATGSQVMVGQQTPGPGGTEAVCFSPLGQTGHVVTYRKDGERCIIEHFHGLKDCKS